MILILILCCTASGTTEVRNQQIELAMRTIGHQLLLSVGDEGSRVLPVEKKGDQYYISFERNFGFEPDTLVAITDRILMQSGAVHDYLVAVEECANGEVMHSFERRSDINTEMIPCRGRTLPEDCYRIRVAMLHFDPAEDDAAVTSRAEEDIAPVHPALFFGAFLFMLGFIVMINQKRELPESGTDIIQIGSMQLDQNNMTLTNGQQRTELSHKESELLALLGTFANSPVERQVILRRVWGDDGDYVGRTLDVFISRLRKRLEPDPKVKIVNIRGVGYKLVVE